MRNTRLNCYDSLETLPDHFRALFDSAGADSYFSSWAWYSNFAATCMDPGDSLLVATVEDAAGTAMGLLPARRLGTPARMRGGREAASLTNFYSCAYAPLIAPGCDPVQVCRGLAAALAQRLRGVDVLDLNTLSREEPLFDMLRESLTRVGLVVQPYFHFVNRYENVSGLGYDRFMARRTGVLRNSIRRRTRRLLEVSSLRHEVVRGEQSLDAAIADYHRIYAASWKEPEPYPEFIPGLIRTAAAAGALRLGLSYIDEQPAAAQIWLTAGGRATIFKMAYDERFKSQSIGSLLTAHMIRDALTHDEVEEIDFGRGDDAYKKDWLPQRRERWGLVAFNPRRPLGFAAAAVRVAARPVKRLFGR